MDDADGFDIAEVEIVVAPTIMPLGDSITRGDMADEPVPELAGYRKPLYNDLLEAGFAAPDDSRTPAFDFVGSTDAAGAALDADFDRDNEGHGGCTDVGIATGQMNGRNCAKPGPYTGITNALNLNPSDIVLLHIGTNNGLERNIGAEGVADILRRIRTWEDSASGNDVTVVLARIIDDRRDGSFNPRRNQVDPDTDVAGFNENLTRLLFKNPNNLSYPLRVDPSDPNVVDGFPDAQGFPRDIILVDQFSTLDPELDEPIENVEDYANRLHPSASGYAKMANVWLRALTGAVGPEILASCPQSSP